MKRLMNLSSLSFLILLLTSSCEKDDDCPGNCTILQGRVTTAGGKESLKDMPLRVVWSGPSGFFPGVKHEKAHGKTDTRGDYRLSFHLKDEELNEGSLSIEYSVDESKYLVLDSRPAAIHPNFGGRQKRDTTVTTDYIIPRKAWLQPRVSGFSAYPDVFYSVFSFKYGQIGPPSWVIQGYWSSPNAEFPLEVPGDQTIQVSTIRQRNGVETFESDSLRVLAGQTVVYEARF